MLPNGGVRAQGPGEPGAAELDADVDLLIERPSSSMDLPSREDATEETLQSARREVTPVEEVDAEEEIVGEFSPQGEVKESRHRFFFFLAEFEWGWRPCRLFFVHV